MTKYYFDASGGYHCDCGEYVPAKTVHTCKTYPTVYVPYNEIEICLERKKMNFTTPEPVVDTTGSKLEIIEPDYKRAYFVLARLVAQANENIGVSPARVETIIRKAMETVEKV